MKLKACWFKKYDIAVYFAETEYVFGFCYI